MSVGVIVGRFQVDTLHSGHLELVEHVMKRHGKVLLLLGCAPTRLLKHDPLDYPTRERMIKALFPGVTVQPIYDSPSDQHWSEALDATVTKMFPTDDAVLYGGRDSFRSHYHGKIPVKEIETINVINGTDLRAHIADRVRDSNDFRAGVIYACFNRFPVSYQVVDVAIVKPERQVLLCRKRHDPAGQWGFIGGFVNPTDPSLESAATREVMEETGIEIGPPKYLGSFRIDDWRYRDREDKMLSAFFVAEYVFGAAKADDDIDECGWWNLDRAMPHIVTHHKPMAETLFRTWPER